jgi:hypothetical protein
MVPQPPDRFGDVFVGDLLILDGRKKVRFGLDFGVDDAGHIGMDDLGKKSRGADEARIGDTTRRAVGEVCTSLSERPCIWPESVSNLYVYTNDSSDPSSLNFISSCISLVAGRHFLRLAR